ncbi:uncharacterized protein LOC133908074 [Phragmites australis]|uniref:uncharacterized protein LOC133908074 n=1 Tax=Phragmites australis TaxID=29695 RepID=UPI002D771B46|nr:uncharacterized protein LOC133908074 [Phragmites australis]
MRIRKRTPARAASPGPSPALSASPPSPTPPLLLQQPKERTHEEEAEEKRVILVGAGARARAGDQEDDRVAAASKNSAMADAPKPEPEPQDAAVRCSRNDGKRWRCKNAVVPGYLFCDRHVAWSTRKRKPRAKKKKNHGVSVLEPATEEIVEDEAAASAAEREDRDGTAGTHQLGRHGGDGFYYYGGFEPGCRKRVRGGGPGPA